MANRAIKAIVSNVPGGQFQFVIEVKSPVEPKQFWAISQISQWKLEDIADQIIGCWESSTPVDSITHPQWNSEKKLEILHNLSRLRERNTDSVWIGVPTVVNMGFQVSRVVLPFFWRAQDKREFIENYLQTSPKFIKVGAYATWKALNEYCVGIKLEEAKEIVREFAPHQLFKPVEARHRAVMAMIAHGPHCWFQLDVIFLNTITNTGYVLLMIDIFTKFLWAWPMNNKESDTTWRHCEGTIRKEIDIWRKIYPDNRVTFKIHTDN